MGQLYEGKDDLLRNAGIEVGGELETRWGHSAMHHGDFPQDWVKPGGLESSGYRHELSGMITGKDEQKRRQWQNLVMMLMLI